MREGVVSCGTNKVWPFGTQQHPAQPEFDVFLDFHMPYCPTTIVLSFQIHAFLFSYFLAPQT